MASSLRDDLALLTIDRRGRAPERFSKGGGRGGPGRGLGLRLLSALLWLIPLSILGGAVYYGYRQYDRIKPKLEVNVGVVQAMTTGEASRLMSAKGYIKSRNQAQIGAKVPGRVEAMYVEEGSKVKKGDVLGVLEHGDLKAQLVSRRAMIDRTRAELKEAQSDLENKDRKARRWISLRMRGIATEEEVEDYIYQRDMAASRVRALEAAIRWQEAQLKEMEETIANMHIIAPFDGTVVEKAAEVGETITPGGMGAASGRGSVVTLANLDMLEVETDVAENLLPRITIGQPAEISVTAVPDRRYRGTLRRIIPMSDRTRGTVKVDVAILDPDDRLFPELMATVHFLPDQSLENPNAGKTFLFVPRDAIVEQDGRTFAWTVDGKGLAQRREVEVAASTDDLARVEKGLKSGDQVILQPPAALAPGMPVKVAE